MNNENKPQDNQKVEDDNWTESGDTINVPDHLMPLFNKVGTQIRFHTISGKNENLTIAHIVRICELHFKTRIAELEKQNAEYREALINIDQMSDPGSPEVAVIRMKQIANKALNHKCTHDNSVWISNESLRCKDCGETYLDEPKP